MHDPRHDSINVNNDKIMMLSQTTDIKDDADESTSAKQDPDNLLSQMPLLFVDDKGKAFLSEEVFFKMCKMNSLGAP